MILTPPSGKDLWAQLDTKETSTKIRVEFFWDLLASIVGNVWYPEAVQAISHGEKERHFYVIKRFIVQVFCHSTCSPPVTRIFDLGQREKGPSPSDLEAEVPEIGFYALNCFGIESKIVEIGAL